jgi:hypothetical protein
VLTMSDVQSLSLAQEGSVQAVSLYARALSVFLWFDRGQDNASEVTTLVDSKGLDHSSAHETST